MGGARIHAALPRNCHSEKRIDEESGAGLPRVSVNPPFQTPSEARGDTLRATFEARPNHAKREK